MAFQVWKVVVLDVETVDSSIKWDCGVGGFGEGIMVRPKAVVICWEDELSCSDLEGTISLMGPSYDDCAADGMQASISDRTTICKPPKS